MKNLKLIFILLIVSSILFSCNKAKTTPASSPPAVASQPSVVTEANRAPLILVTSEYAYNSHGASYMSTTFDNLTASYYSNSLKMHWSTTSSSGPWTNGILPFSFASPTAQYAFGTAFASGVTVYVFYSTNYGTSYPSGSASPVYSVITP